jgi:hypothetical protein
VISDERDLDDSRIGAWLQVVVIVKVYVILGYMGWQALTWLLAHAGAPAR